MRVHQKSHEKKETLIVALMRVDLAWPQSVVSILPADGRARTARVTPRLPVPSWMAQSSTCQASKKSPVPWPPYIFWMPGLACKTGNLADDISQRTSAVSCIFYHFFTDPFRSGFLGFFWVHGFADRLAARAGLHSAPCPPCYTASPHQLGTLAPSEQRHKVFNVHHLDAFGSSFPAPAWNFPGIQDAKKSAWWIPMDRNGSWSMWLPLVLANLFACQKPLVKMNV